MNLYVWTKILHLFFVIAWMVTVFCLPRILTGLVEAEHEAAVRGRLIPFGLRIYRLGHNLFGLAFIFGLVLWLYFRIAGPWLHVKLVLVTLLLVHFTLCGRWLKRVAAGGPPPSMRMLRFFHHVPSFLLLAVIWLVLAKPI